MVLVHGSQQQRPAMQARPRGLKGQALRCNLSWSQGSAVTSSEQRAVSDAARQSLKAAIKGAWSREAVTRGVAAAKKSDYALAHRHATAWRLACGCACGLASSWLATKGLCMLQKLWLGVAIAHNRLCLLGESYCMR